MKYTIRIEEGDHFVERTYYQSEDWNARIADMEDTIEQAKKMEL